MMFKELLGDAFPIIQRIAPAIASALGSPIAGGATLAAVNLLSNAFGISPEKVGNLGDAISNDPKAEITLAALESNFSSFFKANNLNIKMPATVEINIKLAWDQSSQ